MRATAVNLGLIGRESRRVFFVARTTQHVKSGSMLREGLALGAALAGIVGWGSLLIVLSV